MGHSLKYERPEPAKVALISLLAAWTLAWKGVSLWHAAKDDSKPWFIALLLSNTAGLLDALYIFRVSRTRRLAVEDARRDDDYPQQTHTVED
ncbi:DUF5652 family protein [Lacisediminihabitans sp. FW035]